jgi:hypothetical protein
METACSAEPGYTVMQRDSDKTSPVAVSAKRNQVDSTRSSARDAVFAENALSQDLAGDPFDVSTLFAAAPAHKQRGSAPVREIAFVPNLESSPSATSGAAASGTGPVANASTASAAFAGTAGFLPPGHISQAAQGPSWSSYAHDPQHTAISEVPARPLTGIRWQTLVDLDFSSGGTHYGSPLVTQANTVIVPVKTGATDGFKVEGFDGGTGALKWTVATDYSVPTSRWIPPMSVVLTPTNRLYIPGAGGTVYFMDDPDANNATITGQLSFYGISNYDHSYDGNVKICTGLTSDSQGNLYFGFVVYGPTPLSLQSGIARMEPGGKGSWVAASSAAADPSIAQVVFNCAPALSNGDSSLYIAVSSGDSGFADSGSGYLLRLHSATLATTGKVFLVDPNSGQAADLPDLGTASPTVGPDGDVYFGVLEIPSLSNNDRGWLLHFNGDLTQTKLSGAFGWDDTASIVPANMVRSYTGTSAYLLMTKYNNYQGVGTGDGVNKLAVLDPNAMMIDPITGACVMQEVLTITGVTPDPVPPMVREWCINSAAVDPATDSILANSEDGTLYRWDLGTNSFTQSVNLTSPTSEAYTPTVIGVDGTVYAINNATLFAVG